MNWTVRIQKEDTAPYRHNPIYHYEAILTHPKVDWAIIGKGWSRQEAIKHAQEQIASSLITLSKEHREAKVDV